MNTESLKAAEEVVEIDMDPALHDAFREMLLKVPEQKNIAVLVAYVWGSAVKAERARAIKEQS